jgi:hypothetical protein
MTDHRKTSLAAQVRSHVQTLQMDSGALRRQSIQAQLSDPSLGQASSVLMPQAQVCVSAQHYSIAQLERQMMFLNEP